MISKDTVIDTLISLIRIYVIYLIFKNFGFFKTFFFILSFIKIFDFIARKFFKLTRLKASDRLFTSSDKTQRYVIMAILKMKNFNEDRLKDFLVEKVLKVYPKFRSVLYKINFYYYWKEDSLELAESKLRMAKTIHILDDKDLMNYIKIESNNHLKIYDTYAYEFQFVKLMDREGEGCLVIKFDHCFSDGMGIVSLIGSIADNYNPTFYPSIMKKKGFPSFYKIIKDFLTFPYVIYKHKRNIKIDSIINPIHLSTSEESFLGLSKSYNFEELFISCKKLKLSFNEFLIANISAGIKLYLKSKLGDPKNIPKSIAITIPVANRGVPEAKENILIENCASAVFVDLPLIDDPILHYSKIAHTLKESVGNLFQPIFNKMILDICYEIFPDYMCEFFSDHARKRIDICISNVPGCKQSLYYSGSEIYDIISVINSGMVFAFSLILTYNNQLRILLSCDKLLGLDPQEVINCIQKTIDRSISCLENIVDKKE